MLGVVYGWRLIKNPMESLAVDPAVFRGPIVDCEYFWDQRHDLIGEDFIHSNLCTFATTLDVHDLMEPTAKKIKDMNPGCTLQLYITINTTDVHPDIIDCMKKNFSKVIVPFKYMKNILDKHNVNCEYTNWYTCPYLSSLSLVVPKKRNPEEIVFYYNNMNNPATNLENMTKVFDKALKGTKHYLIVRSNYTDNLIKSPNIRYSVQPESTVTCANLYNICDYVVSFSRVVDTARDILEAKYFNKSIIAHDQGSYAEMKDENWITLPSKEVPVSGIIPRINGMDIPLCSEDDPNAEELLKMSYHGNWWEIDCEKAEEIIRKLVKT